MPKWTIKSLVDRRSGTNNTTIVARWFEAQTDNVQAAFLARMKFLQGLPADGWDRPYVGQLRGKPCKGLYEIVLTVDRVQHRPIGYFSGIMEFTIVGFAIEKGGNFIPNTICETSKKIIKSISDGREIVRVIHF